MKNLCGSCSKEIQIGIPCGCPDANEYTDNSNPLEKARIARDLFFDRWQSTKAQLERMEYQCERLKQRLQAIADDTDSELLRITIVDLLTDLQIRDELAND